MSKIFSGSLLLVNIRSTYNVGAIARSAAAFGVSKLYTYGETPYPTIEDDQRLPHVRQRASAQIAKTALGGETLVTFQAVDDLTQLFADLKSQGTEIFALEHSNEAQQLDSFEPSKNWLLILGSETKGLPDSVLSQADRILQITTTEAKRSLNVSTAASIAMFQLTKSGLRQ